MRILIGERTYQGPNCPIGSPESCPSKPIQSGGETQWTRQLSALHLARRGPAAPYRSIIVLPPWKYK